MPPIRARRPKGATGDGGFRATPDMMSILGCSADELGHVLKALGFWAERRLAAPERRATPSRPCLSSASAAGQRRGDAAAGDAANGAVESRRRTAPPDERAARSQPRQPQPAACRCAARRSADRACRGEMGGDLAAPAQGTGLRPAGAGSSGRTVRVTSARRAGLAKAQRRAQDRTPNAMRHEGKGPLRRRDHRRKGPHAARRAAAAASAGVAARAEGRLRSRFAVRGAELAQGGPGKAQPGLIRP